MTKFSESDQKKIATLYEILDIGATGIHTSDGFTPTFCFWPVETEELRPYYLRLLNRAEVVEDYLEGKASLSRQWMACCMAISISRDFWSSQELRDRGMIAVQRV